MEQARSHEEEFDTHGSPEEEREKAAWEQIEARSAYQCYKMVYEMKQTSRRKLMLQWMLRNLQEPETAESLNSANAQQAMKQKVLVLSFPLRYMLEYFTKLFLLNVMEIAVLQCYLAKFDWNLLQKFLKEKCGAIGSTLQLSEDHESPNFHAMSLFLFLKCRTVKQSCSYTGHSRELEAINEEIIRQKYGQFSDTKQLQEELMDLMVQNRKSPSMKEVNKWFRKLSMPYQKCHQDVVENLLQIAKPYKEKAEGGEANRAEVVEVTRPQANQQVTRPKANQQVRVRKPRKK